MNQFKVDRWAVGSHLTCRRDCVAYYQMIDKTITIVFYKHLIAPEHEILVTYSLLKHLLQLGNSLTLIQQAARPSAIYL